MMSRAFFIIPEDSYTMNTDEQFEIQDKIWQALGRQVKLYTVGDSTSIPVETAQELLLSFCFTLEQAMHKKGLLPKKLASLDIDRLLAEGRSIIESKISEGRDLWNIACLGAPVFKTISYSDTLKSIGQFFKRYDSYFLAHQIPCDIEYQLCQPTPEALMGIEYINEYLRRIITENNVLKAFKRDKVDRLLNKCCRDYRSFLPNLCEPLMINATGLLMLEKEPFDLDITDADRRKLAERLVSLAADDRCILLSSAAGRLCEMIGIHNDCEKEYITNTAMDVSPRLGAALKAGDILNIFHSLS